MATENPVVIEGDTIVDALRNNVRRIPDRPALRTRDGRRLGDDDLCRLRPGGGRGHRRARRARHRSRPARRDLLEQSRGVAPRRSRDPGERQRDRARVPDELGRAGRAHSRARRSHRVLRREPRAGRPHPRSEGRSAEARPARRVRGRRSPRRPVRARLRAVAHDRRGASRARARPVRRARRRGDARGARHARVHERHHRPAEGRDGEPRQHHVDAPELGGARAHRRGRAAAVVPSAESHRRAHDERLRLGRGRRRDLVRRAASRRSPKTFATAGRRCSSRCRACGRSSTKPSPRSSTRRTG